MESLLTPLLPMITIRTISVAESFQPTTQLPITGHLDSIDNIEAVNNAKTPKIEKKKVYFQNQTKWIHM